MNIWDEEDIETVIITLQDATGDVDADGILIILRGMHQTLFTHTTLLMMMIRLQCPLTQQADLMQKMVVQLV